MRGGGAGRGHEWEDMCDVGRFAASGAGGDGQERAALVFEEHVPESHAQPPARFASLPDGMEPPPARIVVHPPGFDPPRCLEQPAER
jgi:hypothetical protein